MEELLSTEENSIAKIVRTTARVISVLFIGYIYYRWNGLVSFPLVNSHFDAAWQKYPVLLFDIITVAGCIVAWTRESLGARIVLISAALVGFGSSVLRESGFIHTKAT